jgi:hypothetical protein
VQPGSLGLTRRELLGDVLELGNARAQRADVGVGLCERLRQLLTMLVGRGPHRAILECAPMAVPPAEAAEPGRHLFDELLWVHEKIRHDLRVCEDLAVRVAEGLSPEEVRAEIRELQTNSPLWRLRVNCLYYCRFVHSHHNAEDIALFPALRAANPAMAPIVDRLEADHRSVSLLLDEVEAAADALVVEDAGDIRDRLVTALGNLRIELIAHLGYEEEMAGPTIRSWTSWPFY